VFLRDPELWKIETEKGLVNFLTNNGALIDVDVADCTRMLLHSRQFQIGFVFDGFDEYPYKKNPFILNVIRNRLFPKAVIVCTSRPSASLQLYEYVDRRIQILGFSEDERDNYINISLSDSPDKINKLQNYLKDNPMINDLCFIPLHLAILMYLFWQGMLPETLSELNELFVIHTIFRSMKKSHGQSTSNIGSKLKDLPEKIYIVVCKLCKVAYEGVRSHQLVFTFDEIKENMP